MIKYIFSSIVLLIVFSGCSTKTYMSDGKNSVKVQQSQSSGEEILESSIGQYEGSTKFGIPHGYGVYTWNSGEKYNGNYINGKKNGKGKFTWIDGTLYEGNFRNGLRDGIGIQSLDNSYTLSGNFSNIKCLSCDYKTYPNNNNIKTINGDFNLQSNYVTPLAVRVVYNDNTVYKGEVNSLFFPNGTGYKIYSDGLEKVTGRWINGELTKEISRIYTRKYFEKIKKEEKCKLLNSGWVYLGNNCNNNLASGNGSAINFDGKTKFNGEFQDGLFLSGTLINGNNKLEGQFRNGKLNGKAISYIDDEIIYEGEYRDGYQHGKGVCLYNNEYESCEYFHNKRVDTLYKQRIIKKEDEKKRKLLAQEQIKRDKTQRRTTRYKQQRTTPINTTGKVIVNNILDCAKGLLAKKACEKLPWPANTICISTAKSNFPCLGILGK